MLRSILLQPYQTRDRSLTTSPTVVQPPAQLSSLSTTTQQGRKRKRPSSKGGIPPQLELHTLPLTRENLRLITGEMRHSLGPLVMILLSEPVRKG